jgi:hypothetical protein
VFPNATIQFSIVVILVVSLFCLKFSKTRAHRAKKIKRKLGVRNCSTSQQNERLILDFGIGPTTLVGEQRAMNGERVNRLN